MAHSEESNMTDSENNDLDQMPEEVPLEGPDAPITADPITIPEDEEFDDDEDIKLFTRVHVRCRSRVPAFTYPLDVVVLYGVFHTLLTVPVKLNIARHSLKPNM